MKVGLWSTAAGSNNSTPPDGWPEGQAPSTINDCAREMMAAIRTYLADAQYFDPGNTPSYLSATTFSLNAADATTFHVGRRVKMLDGSAVKYGVINSVSATFVAVRLDPNTADLTASLSAVAVGVAAANPHSLPSPVFRRNIIINSTMDIWQRGNGPFVPANNVTTFTADRWAWGQSASCSVNVTRAERSANAANVPTLAQAGQFLNSSLRVSVSAVDAALASGEHAFIRYAVEGYDWRQIAHKPNVLSFWANSNRSGIYCVALRNKQSSASFVQNYTISAVNTWSRFAITIPEAPSTVTWNYSQSAGVVITWCMGAGSSWMGGAGNWTATNVLATTDQQNFVASAGNVFMLTGVQFEEGTMATDLETKLISDEMSRCQRYFTQLPLLTTNSLGAGPASAAAATLIFASPMRGAPTISGVTAAGSGSTISFYSITSAGFRYLHTNSGGSSTDFSVSCDAEI